VVHQYIGHATERPVMHIVLTHLTQLECGREAKDTHYRYVNGKVKLFADQMEKSKFIITHNYYMSDILRRTFSVGDLVTIAPDFRNTVLDFDFEKYIGIIMSTPEENEYTVYWTSSPTNSYYKGMWNGDHLVKVEDYEIAKERINSLHRMEI